MKERIEQLEQRIAELTNERNEYDKRRREAIADGTRWRDECLQWREIATALLIDYDGVYSDSRPCNAETPWKEINWL